MVNPATTLEKRPAYISMQVVDVISDRSISQIVEIDLRKPGGWPSRPSSLVLVDGRIQTLHPITWSILRVYRPTM